MKKLSKKVNEVNDEVKDLVKEDDSTNNEESVSVIEDNTESVSMERLNLAVEKISKYFGLESNYVVTGFKSAGRKITVSFSSVDFDIVVTMKNSEEMGIPNE